MAMFNGHSSQLTKETLLSEIRSADIAHWDIVYAQAILESGNLKSRLVIGNNNLFGMRKPLQRQTLAMGKRSGYAYYSHWVESVWDYKLYQEHIFKAKGSMSRSQYLRYIAKTYSTTPDYVKRVMQIVNKLKR